MAATAPVDRGSGVPARLPAENDKPLAPARAATARPKRRRRPEPHRWMREARGILAIVVAGFAIVSLAVFDPALLPTDQGSPVGPVGWWLGWALFRALGYAGFLLPMLLGAWGVAAFVSPRMSRGWVPLAGLALLLIAAAGILQQAADTFAAVRITRGGIIATGGWVGWTLTAALDAALGRVGSWLLLLAALPVGVLLVTQASYAAIIRLAGARLAKLRRARRVAVKPSGPRVELDPVFPAIALPALPEVTGDPPPPVVVEPAKPRGRLMEQGLAWQETFDFGKGGAQSFQLPPVGLLKPPPVEELRRTREELQDNAEVLRRKLQDFEVDGRIVQVSPGPIITSYEFEPAPGVKVSQVVNLSDDLALALKAASVRIVGPIPGRGTVAIEVPNDDHATVYLREIFISPEFAESKGKLPLALGKDVQGQPVVADLTAMPHLLIAGATGSGKSVGLNGMICSILYKATPADVRFLMIDPKRLELSCYEGIPHLLAPVVTDAKEAAARLRWIVGKMDERYKTLQHKQVRNIEGYNRAVAPEERLPYWVVVVDELADLMMVSAGEVQTSLVRLAQIARAVGIHLIIATQRPSVDVVTGLIKANFPTRIAFQVASKVDSRTVLDGNGAEQLLGRGDMIYVPPGANKQMRVHGAWVADDEVKGVCEFLRKQGTAVYEEVVLPADGGAGESGDGAERDDLYWECVRLVIGQRQGSISFLQRRMSLGYPKAARFIDMMEQDRIIGPGQGAKPREILVGPEFLAKVGR
ncbi:MAG TPA: DNA translocase FtsK 4TM domain-containing protein [Methylomirabilota bacterium]|jgi:S-DNA-T family DNA segregation ATPase FtsK/SpoIIIE|nr:DNA translocase FtsK 4TM domain-containing protein [Methylomirabilota bacterium]